MSDISYSYTFERILKKTKVKNEAEDDDKLKIIYINTLAHLHILSLFQDNLIALVFLVT